MPTTVLEMSEATQSFAFEGLSAKPVPSILRGFSAPVVLERETSADEKCFLLAHDTDAFNRWEASRDLGRECLVDMITEGADPDLAWIDALGEVVRDDALDPAFRSMMLALPTQAELAQLLHSRDITPDPDAIHAASEALRDAMAQRWAPVLPEIPILVLTLFSRFLPTSSYLCCALA